MSFRLANLDSRAVLVDATGYAYDLETISDGRLGPDLMAAIADIDALHDLDATLGDRDPTGRLDAGVAPVDRGVGGRGSGRTTRAGAISSPPCRLETDCFRTLSRVGR